MTAPTADPLTLIFAVCAWCNSRHRHGLPSIAGSSGVTWRYLLHERISTAVMWPACVEHAMTKECPACGTGAVDCDCTRRRLFDYLQSLPRKVPAW
jgi:hypothetical protein